MRKENFFDPTCCQLCGECLFQCPVLNYPLKRAKQEKSRLNQAKPSSVLDLCTTCFSCNYYCPNQCSPYELVLLRWQERYEQKGLPAIARMVVPTEPASLWSQLYPFLDEEELEQIKKWRESRGKEEKELLLTGCFSGLNPLLAKSRIFSELIPFGNELFWCSGGHIYQLGLLELVEEIGTLEKEFLEQINPKRIITLMNAEYVMLKRIFPEKFGLEIPFPALPLEQWLLQRIKGGELKLEQKIKKKITIHDNCFSKPLGEESWQAVREIVRLCGAEIVEMRHHQKDALCCGFGAGAGRFNLFDLLNHGWRRLKEAEESGADWLLVYCSACYFILSVVKALVGSRLEIYHLSELAELSCGAEPRHKLNHRAWDLLAIISAQVMRMVLFKKERERFWIAPELLKEKFGKEELELVSDSLTSFLRGIYQSRFIQNPLTRAGIHLFSRMLLSLQRRGR